MFNFQLQTQERAIVSPFRRMVLRRAADSRTCAAAGIHSEVSQTSCLGRVVLERCVRVREIACIPAPVALDLRAEPRGTPAKIFIRNERVSSEAAAAAANTEGLRIEATMSNTSELT